MGNCQDLRRSGLCLGSPSQAAEGVPELFLASIIGKSLIGSRRPSPLPISIHPCSRTQKALSMTPRFHQNSNTRPCNSQDRSTRALLRLSTQSGVEAKGVMDRVHRAHLPCTSSRIQNSVQGNHLLIDAQLLTQVPARLPC